MENPTWEEAHPILKANWKLATLFDDFFSSPISIYFQKFIKPNKFLVEVFEKEETILKKHYDSNKGESVPEYILYYIYRPSIILASDHKDKLEIICQYLKTNLGKNCGVTTFLPFQYFFEGNLNRCASAQNLGLKYFESQKETIGVEDRWGNFSTKYWSIIMGIPEEDFDIVGKDREKIIDQIYNFVILHQKS